MLYGTCEDEKACGDAEASAFAKAPADRAVCEGGREEADQAERGSRAERKDKVQDAGVLSVQASPRDLLIRHAREISGLAPPPPLPADSSRPFDPLIIISGSSRVASGVLHTPRI